MSGNKERPPLLASWILKKLMPGYICVSAMGDFEEIYSRIAKQEGNFKATLWAWRQVLKAVPQSIYWSFVMLRNYQKTSWRNLLKYKVNSAINLFGLAIGMTCAFLMLLWIQDELSFDRFHENANRIFRVIYEYESDGQVRQLARTPAPLASALANDFQEITSGVTIHKNVYSIEYQNKRFFERVFFADPEFFDIFTFPLVKGDHKTALKEPYTLVISEDMSRKFFGEDNPVGKILTLDKRQEYQITGVFKNIPTNSHLRLDFLASFTNYKPRYMDQWGVSNFYTYVLASEEFSHDDFQNLMPDFIEKYRGREARYVNKIKYVLQPLTSIHLYSHLRDEIGPNGNINNIFIFSAVALFILLIACFNYINLSTARYTTRTREVGVRKVVGAYRLQIIKQFLGESIYLAAISFFMAVITIQFFLPVFNSLTGKELRIDYLDNQELLLGMISILLVVGVAAGGYPALFFSSFQPVKVLRGMEHIYLKGKYLRKIFIVAQFAISIILIVGTLTVYHQLRYVRNSKLGFNKEHVVNIPLNDEDISNKIETIKNEFLQNPGIVRVSASNFFPGRIIYNQNYWYEGAQEGENPLMQWISVDHDFLETYEIGLISGRNFSKKFPSDIERSYILNEAAVKEIGWESPVDKQFGINKKGTVIGVVKDFHFKSLHQRIEPIALCIYPGLFEYLSVRIRPENISLTLDFMKNKWRSLVPNQTFEYSFLDEDYDNLYKTEIRLRKIFSFVTFFAISIACLGLFGLIALTAELRTKEIGIRKVLGASISGIVVMLSKEFLRLVLFANIIAWPIAWYAMNRWLKNFSYRIDIGMWTFLLAGMLALIIAFFTISYQSIKAATSNPIDSLRYE